MQTEKIDSLNRKQVNEFIKQRWFSTKMIVHEEIIDMTKLDGFFMSDMDENIIALATYRFNKNNKNLEIISLDSVFPNHGLGSLLLNKIIFEAKNNNCTKISLITTNDNTNALRFYQKRGFNIKNFYYDAIKMSRKIKPEIPFSGIDNIPLRHEIELEMILDNK